MKPVWVLLTWGFAVGSCLTVTLHRARCHDEADTGVTHLGFCGWWLPDRDIAPREMPR